MQARTLLIGLALMGPAVGMAQSFEEKISDISLLQNKKVQEELGVTEALRTKMNKFADDFNAKANAAQADFQKKNPNAQQPTPEFIQKINGYQATLKKNIIGALSKAQLKRLSELTLQAAGYPAMLDPTVSKQVGLTEAQIKKLRETFQVMGQSVQKLQEKAMKPIYDKYANEKPETEEAQKALQEKVAKESQAAMEKIKPDLDKLRDEWLTTVKKTVKAIQLNKFEALQGKPFKG